jgi:hypothetical protein
VQSGDFEWDEVRWTSVKAADAPSASLRPVKAESPSVGKIKRVALREVWTHEALDFTTWLEQNVDVLNELLDVTLVNVEREQSAGSFSVDLVAEDEAGNQL